MRDRARRSYQALVIVVIAASLLSFATKYTLSSRNLRENEPKSFLPNPLYPGTENCGDFPCIGDAICKSLALNLVRIKDFQSYRKDGDRIVYDGLLYHKYMHRSKNVTIHILGEPEIPHRDVNASLKTWDQTLCEMMGQATGCSPIDELKNLTILQEVAAMTGTLDETAVRNLSPNLICATQRLVNRIVRRAAAPDYGYVTVGKLTLRQKKSLIFKLMAASTNWFGEVFPSNERWPFVMSHGACGRIIVNKGEYGTPLNELFEEPWKSRVDLASQILDIVSTLSENDNGYFFGVGDISPSYFVRSAIGKLKIDIYDGIVIKDTRQALHKARKLPQTCYLYNKAANFRAACRILVGEDGLLRGGEEQSTFQLELQKLLKRCLRRDGSTVESFDKLRSVLATLRPCEKAYFYRYPECEYRTADRDSRDSGD